MTWFRRSVHPEDELSAYVDGELGERARRAVEAHVAGCETCSTLLKELQDTKSLLSELPRPELRRSLMLGPQFAVERRTATAPRRMSFSFAPAVALSVLVALLFVDAVDFSAGGSSNDEAFDAAASTASRQSAPEAGGGLELEATKAGEEPAAAAEDAGADAGPTTDAGEAGAVGGAAGAAPTEDSEDAGTAASALAPEQPGAESTPAADSPLGDAESATAEAPPQELAPSPQTRTEEPETFAIEAAGDEDDGAAPAGGPEDTHVLGTEDSSGGLSTLRILQIVAAIAFAASLVAVFVPRIAGRRER